MINHSPIILSILPLQRQRITGQRVIVRTVDTVHLLVLAEHVVGVPAVGAVVELQVLETRVAVQGRRFAGFTLATVPRLQVAILC